jgi:ribosomal protein S18 acetylase RimI-like enzyme
MAFKATRLAALLDSPSAFGSTYAKESQFSDTDWVKRTTVWTSARSIGYLATDAGNPCGLVAAFIDEHDPLKAHLVSMWVAPAYRRCGAGKMLVSAVVAWAIERGAHTLRLMVTSSNVSAIQFYERNVFVLTGKKEPYPNDPNLVEYEMSRQIVQLRT